MSAYESVTRDSEFTMRCYKHAADFIRAMRQVREKSPDIYDYLVQTTLDMLKYDLDNVENKTPIRRAIERRFKKVREIPNLHELMKL